MRSQFASRFQDGDQSVVLLKGRCEIQQGDDRWTAPYIVLWQETQQSDSQQRIIAYLESTIEEPAAQSGKPGQPYFVLELETSQGIRMPVPGPREVAQDVHDPVYRRARERREPYRSRIRQTQLMIETPFNDQGFGFPPPPQMTFPRRVTIGPKFLGERFELNGAPLTNSVPAEWVMTVSGGVNIVVDNVPMQMNGQMFLTRVDLTADRAVIWTDAEYIRSPGSFDINENTPFQVYLEGNIVVRQAGNTVTATHAFYDINRKRGLAMNAEVRSALADYQGTLRLRAAQVRQHSETSFHAQDAYFTTSEFGKPKYRVQASDIFLEERMMENPFRTNPETGLPENSMLWVTSHNNVIYAEDMPIFAAPFLSSPAEEIPIPVRKFRAGYSGMFGAQLETEWDLNGLFGIQVPPGIDWTLQADYFSKRGPGVGTRTEYDTTSDLFGMPVDSVGFGQLYYLHDRGRDNLGLGRRNLIPPNKNRGRALWRNKTHFDEWTWLQAEVGHVFNNDRNFMEQYFETEWDNDKDLENLVTINHQYDNFTASAMASVRSNNFENQTNWLPKADLTLLSEPVFNTPLLWSTHSSVGYGQVRPAHAPPDPVADPFTPLSYYQDIQGMVAMSRHELSLPFQLGPVNVAPYALGEVAHWQEDMTGSDLTRWYGSGGIRASVQFSKYMPQVQNRFLGLNGLAHKVVFDADYYFADSSQDLNVVPQYNEFDDNAQERFQSRFIGMEYGGTLPPMFDPRNYAVRSGAGRAVTSPFHELVDDQQTLWLGMRHRWQTKVGPPEAPRIVDWMELDLGTGIFPNADKDNFGETLGIISGRYAWHVSPRTSILSNGVFDVFNQGQNVWNVGVLTQRSARGSLYMGYRNVNVGPVESQLLTGSVSYVLSPNLYVMTAGTSFDIAEGMSRGESMTITRIGEYFLLHLGLGYDRSRDNVGAALSFEPKFGNYGSGSMQLNSLLGIQ